MDLNVNFMTNTNTQIIDGGIGRIRLMAKPHAALPLAVFYLIFFFFQFQLVSVRAYAVLGMCLSVGILILGRVRGNEEKKK